MKVNEIATTVLVSFNLDHVDHHQLPYISVASERNGAKMHGGYSYTSS
jgi:hypothetical protein